MAVESTPVFIQAGSHPANLVRRALASMLGNRSGILTPADLLVSQRGAGANMSVDVATGQVAVMGDEATYQGVYLVENRGTLNLSIAAADPTNPRRDLVVVRIRDSEYSGGTDAASIEVVTGTPAGSPSDPSLPSGTVFVLARVAVAAAATSISSGNITDLRRNYDSSQYGLMTAAGGTIVCDSSTRPPSPHEGMVIYEIDTDRTLVYDSSAWVVTSQLGAWNSFTPTLTQSGTVAKTVNEGRYSKVGRTVTGVSHMTVTGSGSSGNAIAVGLPVAAKSFSGTPIIGTFWCYDASAGTGYSGALVLVSTTTAVGWAHAQTGNIGVTPAFGLASSDQVGHSFSYEAAS